MSALSTVAPTASVAPRFAVSPARAARPQQLRVEPRLIRLVVDEVAIASSACAIWLDDGASGALFVPLGDVRADLLRPTGRGRACPRLGLMRYWSLRLSGLALDRAARVCESPAPGMARLRDHVIFDWEQLDRVKKVRSWLH